MGIPGGILIDSKGPRWGVALGCVLLAIGYFGLKSAYDNGPDSMGVAMLCLFALSSGSGSCTAFSAALKASASNWPSHRGTATAFPLSALGLSAFFYTTLATLIYPGDTSGYLKLLAYGTTAMTFVGMLFLRIVDIKAADEHTTAYGIVAPEDEPEPQKRRNSNRLHRTGSTSAGEAKHTRGASKNSMFSNEDETESLVTSSNSSEPGDILNERTDHKVGLHHEIREITGWELARTPKFWQLFVLLALLCGVGLMTINNIGNDARSLWRHYDDSASKDFIMKRQLMHVSILSVCSFLGRLTSGIGSDWLIHHHASRYWTLVASACIFVAAQVIALVLENPNHLFLLSGFSGGGYGVLFGTYPALVADAFGARGLGINWGMITWAPVVSGNVFNLVYGSTLDSHSVFEGDPNGTNGEMVCLDGKECYATAYWVTLASSVVGVIWSLWCIRQERLGLLKEQKERARTHQP